VEPARAGAPAAGAAPAVEPVAGVIRVREPARFRVRVPAPGWVQSCAPVRMPAQGRVPVAVRVLVEGRVPGSAADSVAASQTVSCPGPTAFPQFGVITASHPERA
jgi:hypothetical protein